MHGTKRGPSLSKRCSGMPCMPGPLWPLPRLQQLRIVLTLFLLLVGKQLG